MAAPAPPQGQQPPPGEEGQITFQFPPGQQPSQEQILQMQRQLAMDAQKNGMTVPQFIQKLKEQQLAAQQQQAAAQQQAQQAQQQQQQTPIQPGPPKPEALAVANFLMKQDLKLRTCILNDQRKNMFKGKLHRT